MDPAPITFGPFALYPSQRILLERGQPVRLGSRAFDILVMLVERAGEVVGKNDLIARVWPTTVVEENSLRVHIASLRRILGDGHAGARYVTNHPGRGYCFVAPVSLGSTPPTELPSAPSLTGRPALPSRLTRTVGRDDAILMLADLLARRRLVTVAGPGGVGKTTVTLAVAERIGSEFGDGFAFVDLAPVADGHAVPTAIAMALGLPNVSGDAVHALSSALGDKHILLVIDNCEHVVEHVAPLIEQLLMAAARLTVISTSREPLHAQGEWVYRLPALTVPDPDARLPAHQAMAFSAVELFVERATSHSVAFELTDDNAAMVGDICRRLDGNALAIELATARVDFFGLKGLSAQLNVDVLRMTRGRRTAAARHRTLEALLDWSYSLLGEPERDLLDRLSVFAGRFPLEAACSIAGPSLTATDVLNIIASLTDRSLLASDAGGEVVLFHLLEVTRAYCRAKLDLSGRRQEVEGLRAHLLVNLLRQGGDEWVRLGWREWRETYGWALNDARMALGWCFSDGGDRLAGSRLTAELWTLVLSMDPFDKDSAPERALKALQGLPGSEPELEMRLTLAVATTYGHRPESSSHFARIAYDRALALAASTGDSRHAAEVLAGLVGATMAHGDYERAAELFKKLRLAANASRDASTGLIADRIGGQVLHLGGRHARGRVLAERVLRQPVARAPLRSVASGVDHAIFARIVKSRILWIQGFADQARSIVDEALEMAENGRAYEVCQVLSLAACPLAIWCGDGERAKQVVTRFEAACAEHAFQGRWLPASANIPWWTGLSVGRQAPPLNPLHLHHLITANTAFATEAAARIAVATRGWANPEILRAHGECLLTQGRSGAREAAGKLFERAIAMARRDGALAWELRAAVSLARLQHDGQEFATARALVAITLDRFVEGFDTADVRHAHALLGSPAVNETSSHPRRFATLLP